MTVDIEAVQGNAKLVVRLDAAACRDLLPHRDVMALIDGVNWYNPMERHLSAFKRIATSEFSVRGYFPGRALFPRSMVIEGLAQACGIMMNMERMRDLNGTDLLRLDDVYYRRELPPIPLSVLADSTIKQYAHAGPGDTLEFEVKVSLQRQEFRYFKVVARVEDSVIADGTILLSYPSYFQD